MKFFLDDFFSPKYLEFEIKQMLEILILQETRHDMLNVGCKFQPPLCHD